MDEKYLAWRRLRLIMASHELAVHHLDGDPTNNTIENLICVPLRHNPRRSEVKEG